MPRKVLTTLVLFLTISSLAIAEDESITEQAERLAAQPSGETADLGIITRRAKLTEEQAVNQLRYMTVQGWKRVENELNERGSFKAFGLTLTPQGEFNAVHVDTGGKNINSDARVAALVKTMKNIANTRAVWAVGMMYVTGEVAEDGSTIKRIGVVGEHIAGWARAWSYPYKVDEGGVRLGNSKEIDMDPIYFTQQ